METFDEKGFVIIKSIISDETADKLVDEMYNKNVHNKTDIRVQDAWKNVDLVGQIAFNKNILDLLHELYGKKPIPFQTLNFYYGTQQRPHSDQIHFCSDPVDLMCGVWIALEDVTMRNGPLVYYPGSHKLPFYNMQDLGLTVGDYGSYENKIAEIIKNSGIEPEYGIIKKGDAIIWAANLIHGGSSREDGSSRMSMVTHYFFEGSETKYWTPVLSSPGKIMYRNPRDFINKKFEA